MVFLVYSIPFVTAVILLLFFRKQTVWWEYILVILPSLLLTLFIEFICKKVNTSDTEYLGYYVRKITYYQPWNEYIHRTCYRTVRCGKVTTRIPYDCSYVDDHPAQYTYTLNSGEEIYFYNKEEFQKVLNKMRSKAEFRDMHRDYYTEDGDAYDYFWNQKPENCATMTISHSYTNYVKSSHSLFKYEDISKKEAKKLGLYDYPEIVDYDQNPIIGYKLDNASINSVKYLNGYYGLKYQFRIYILVYPDKDVSIVEKQRSYWQGANKNEFIVCIGYDTKKKVINWCECFSWADTPVLEVKTKDFFLTHNKLNFVNYSKFLKPYITKQWHRKHFEDFKYIEVEMTDTQVTILLIIVLLFNIGISVWVIDNNYDNRGKFDCD